MEFIKNLIDYASKHPDNLVLSDCSPGGEISYGQLISLSGKVYHYLKSHNIGREDFVNILLPRGVEAFIAMIGVWRAGAAFVVLEEGYPQERIAYIQEDCGCKLVLDYAFWQEIQGYDSIPGFEIPDGHDAAYAVYTSGSTGKPKGVLHEYGNIDRAAASLGYPLKRFGLIAPLNFVATQIAYIVVCHYGGTLFVLPYATVKNPSALVECFISNNLTETFCAPSIYPMFRRIPSLRILIVSSEPAFGIWSEDPNLTVHNVYAMSESGLLVCGAILDAPNEIAPIGQPRFPLHIVLRDEDGNPVPDGETGEFCYENPFVRGYINLPEETARTFINGETHTHDYAKRLPSGDYIILGRVDDMIKIHGNRVEPGEIEAAAMKVTGLRDVIVKGVENNGVTQICLYYVKEQEIDGESVRQEMLKLLPYYMIPSQFIRLDKLPRTQSGKLSRKLLPLPKVSADRKYDSPETETERILCDAMARVLKLDRVGAMDDFYEIGGNSIASIQLVGDCTLDDLNVSQIFRGRTPRKIAEIYESERDDEVRSDDEKNRNALGRDYPLTAEQCYMFDYLLYSPNTAMLNLYSFLKLSPKVEEERFAKALNATLQSHPSLLTRYFFGEDSEPIQRYCPETYVPIEVEHVTEKDLDSIKETLVQPYISINHPVYRSRLFKTEEALYLFLDFNHMALDGTSYVIIINEIMNRYLKPGEIDKSKPDNYYLMLSGREKESMRPKYTEDKAYYEKNYGSVKWSKHLNTGADCRGNRFEYIQEEIKFVPEELNELVQNSGLGKNGLFIAAELLALAAYNQEPDVMVSWIYKGRDNQRLQNVVGLLFRELPVAIRFDPKTTLGSFFLEIQEQITQGIVHSSYPWVSLHASPRSNDNIVINYQDMMGFEKNLPMPAELIELPISGEDASESGMEVIIRDVDDANTDISAEFSGNRFKAEDITRFVEMMFSVINDMIKRREKLDTTLERLFEGLGWELPRR